ncbi:hypothetical protein QFZ79_002915 [Arthrobacter sp. V4I6]|uniref:hypothetical protein n=1 Tax=Arthrobacter sp. V4I6 TaxID=3042281 RepID=UPI00278A2FCA|nr:hypothetical protein [Arthrobacter sp. V4I6]MDQ0854804.1 hypothetical protein [Arthrobacter sp. V4I6]
MAKYDQRLYRVQGERRDGTTHTRDYLSLAKAESAVTALGKTRTIERDGAYRTVHPLSSIRITRSAPIRWLYPEQEGTQ